MNLTVIPQEVVFFESACLLDSVSIYQRKLVQILLQAFLKQQELGGQKSQPYVVETNIFGGKYCDNFSPETQQIEQSWVACIWLLVT